MEQEVYIVLQSDIDEPYVVEGVFYKEKDAIEFKEYLEEMDRKEGYSNFYSIQKSTIR